MEPTILLLLAFVAATLLTGAVRALAPRLSLLDRPNERSLHVKPTPRGGGIGIVLAFLALVGALVLSYEIPRGLGWAMASGAGIVAVLGLLDDRFTLPNTLRMPIWFAAAAGAVWLAGGLPRLDLGLVTVSLGLLGPVLATIAVVWMTNLYNFMDGIDGLAGSQGVVAAAAGGWLLLRAGAPGLALVSFGLAAACLGFLVWNWPPSRVFMGDVGSGTLGFVFAVLALASENAGAVPILAWGILLAPFLVDATFTVARRILRGEPFYKPHRSHAYQRLVLGGRSHRSVTLAFVGLDLALVPLAHFAAERASLRLPLALAVVVALGFAWWAIQRKANEILK